MDKRKVIILAIALFLIIGLGTFVFAGGSEENEGGQGGNTINTPDNNGGDNGQGTPSDDVDGETEGEGGNAGNQNRPAGGNVADDDEELVVGDNENENQDGQNTDNTKAELLAQLQAIKEKIEKAEDLDDIDSARVDRTEELVSAVEDLNDEELNELLAEINEVLDDTIPPVINGLPETEFTNKDVKLSIDEDVTITLNGKEVTKEDIALLGEGSYELSVLDKAFNETTATFTVDKTYPALLVNDSEVADGETIYVNKDAKMTVDEDNLESFTSNGIDITKALINNGYWTAQKDGEYNIEVTDKAGNKTTYKVVVDQTPIPVNHLYVKNNTHEEYNVSEENRYKVIGNGQELYVEYVLKEEFTTTPILTIGGKEYKMSCGTASWNDELYKCDAHVTISEDMNLTKGEEIPFTITGVKDEAQNETIVTEKDVTVTDKYGKVVYDSDPAQSIWVYILNADEDHRTIIGNKQKLIVEINVNEELLVNPVITIGNYQEELTRRANDSRYIYSKTITIDADEMKLVHDENIAFTISVTDVAGNEFKFTKATTNTAAGYGEVVYDGEAPEYEALGILNVTHLRLNNKGASESLTVANIGDEIRVLVRFDEELALTPRLQVGNDKELYLMKLTTNSANYTYYADVELTAEMFDEDGQINFQISGYADAVGNIGDVLDVDDIKEYEDYFGVTLDTTKPLMTINGESNITLEAGDDYDELGVTVEDAVDGTKVLEPVRINYSIDGKFQGTVPAVDPTKPGTYKVVYEYTDAAGNVGVDANRADHDYVIRTVTVLPEGTTSLVNGVSYETLSDAVDAAKVNGGTVELVADVVNSSSIRIANNEEVTVDLNGNDISFASDQYFAVSGGTLTLTGEGTVKEGDPYYGPIFIDREIMQGSPLTINVDEGVTLEGYSGIFVDYGKAYSAMNTTINLKGNINAVRDRDGYVGYAIYVQGKIKNTNNYPVINIYEGSEINSVGMGIYAAGYAEWNIYGGIINAKETAIGIKSGKLNITGGTFTADRVNNIPTPAWGNGIIGSGSALQIESNDGYAQGMEINISGGEFISENAAAIYEYPDDATTSVIAFTITGGTFKSTNYSSNFVFSQSFTTTHQGFMSNITFDKENSVLDSYLAEGYILEEEADGIYKVVKG